MGVRQRRAHHVHRRTGDAAGFRAGGYFERASAAVLFSRRIMAEGFWQYHFFQPFVRAYDFGCACIRRVQALRGFPFEEACFFCGGAVNAAADLSRAIVFGIAGDDARNVDGACALGVLFREKAAVCFVRHAPAADERVRANFYCGAWIERAAVRFVRKK